MSTVRVALANLRVPTTREESVLLATEGVDRNVHRSARNIAGVMVLPGADLNAFALLRQRHLVIPVAEMDRILGR